MTLEFIGRRIEDEVVKGKVFRDALNVNRHMRKVIDGNPPNFSATFLVNQHTLLVNYEQRYQIHQAFGIPMANTRPFSILCTS